MPNPKTIKIPYRKGGRFEVKDTEDIDYTNNSKPLFSFHYMKRGAKFCLSKCEKKEKSSFADTLLNLSQLTWEEISNKPKDGLGYERISVKSLKSTLPSSITEEVEKVTVFRFSDSGRMAGIRDSNIFHIIFVGRNHDLYD
ncbi:MAG: hypothetical protein HQK98_09060 [Nitrospirae bacterium]|nr:hypothetical protein [Nitrospirota bacterium]